MSALLSHRYWSRADAPGRTALLAALAALQPGQRLRLSDVVRSRTEESAPGAPEGEAAAQRADAPPPLVDYSSTAIRAAMVDTSTREVEFSFSSEAPYERWWGVEILGHDPGECDMSWIASGRAPFLCHHDTDEQIGIITRAWRDAKAKCNRAAARFGRSADAEEEMQDAADGTRVNISVGYEIRELELVKKDGDVATYRVTDWLPLEGFVRDVVHGRTQMHGCFLVAGNEVRCEAWTAQSGHLSRQLVAPGPVEHLGLHNVVADCLVGACRGATSPGEEFPVRCVTQSTADYGLGGYGIHLVPPLVTYVGREAVDVAAGTFQGLHFRVRWSDQVPKYSDFWVSDDFVPLRLLGASGDVSYELFELDGSL